MTWTWPLRAAQCSAVRPAYALLPTCDVVAGSVPASSTKNLTASRRPAPAAHRSAPLPCLSTAAFASHPSSLTRRRSASTSPRRAASSPGSGKASTFPEAMSASRASPPPVRPAARSSALLAFLPAVDASAADPRVEGSSPASSSDRTTVVDSARSSSSTASTASEWCTRCLVFWCHHSARSPATNLPHVEHLSCPAPRRAS